MPVCLRTLLLLAEEKVLIIERFFKIVCEISRFGHGGYFTEDADSLSERIKHGRESGGVHALLQCFWYVADRLLSERGGVEFTEVLTVKPFEFLRVEYRSSFLNPFKCEFSNKFIE